MSGYMSQRTQFCHRAYAAEAQGRWLDAARAWIRAAQLAHQAGMAQVRDNHVLSAIAALEQVSGTPAEKRR